jgi:hypothetical protein
MGIIAADCCLVLVLTMRQLHEYGKSSAINPCAWQVKECIKESW